MFYYYGRKAGIASLYPKSSHNIIIEPFAGSAAYALLPENVWKQVILIEKDKGVYDLWKWLIEDATQSDLMNMGYVKQGDVVNTLLQILHSSSKRAFTYRKMTVTKVLEGNWNRNLPKMVELLPKIKHWHIIHGSYEYAPDVEATWFVDPPYQGDAGTGYRCSSADIDYEHLSSWCMSRQGQLIACEGGSADWLPFEQLVIQSRVAGKKNVELIYTMDTSRVLEMKGGKS